MKKERMIIAFLSLLFLLPGCKEEKTVSLMQMSLIVLVGHTLERLLLQM